MTREEKVRGAMRSGEWLRTQWIARVAFDERPPCRVTRAVLRQMQGEGAVERRDAVEHRTGDVGGVTMAYTIPRDEWRLAVGM